MYSRHDKAWKTFGLWFRRRVRPRVLFPAVLPLNIPASRSGFKMKYRKTHQGSICASSNSNQIETLTQSPATLPRFVHFIAGAFVGASPKTFYNDFLESLAEECEAPLKRESRR